MNNAAWVLRRTPLFLLAGDGQNRFQPIHVRPLAFQRSGFVSDLLYHIILLVLLTSGVFFSFGGFT